MLRQLLTLLAVISGFTLAAEPVSAAQGAVVSVAASDAQADCVAAENAPLQMAAVRRAIRAGQVLASPARSAIVLVPAVQLQADRARE